MEHIIVKNKKISFPRYAQLHSRLETFNADSLKDSFLYKSRMEYANAGFFYMGEGDKTVCYYCGGGLLEWEATDNPWKEHARWFSRCPYVLVRKGNAFVQNQRPFLKPHPVKTFETKPAENKIEGNECIVCLSCEKDLLFLPCRHCCTCSACGLMFNNCILCRTPIAFMMKIFITQM